VFLVGNSKEIEEIKNFILQSPQLGYNLKGCDEKIPNEDFVKKDKIDLIVLGNKNTSSLALKYFHLGVDIQSSKKFYETIFNKIPLSELEESWFFENIINKRPFYQFFKNIFEFIVALFLIILLFPLFLLICFLVKITSSGPIIYKQKRVGKNGKIFTLYKFRTMIKDAEKYGLKKDNSYDPRVTPLGRILRKTHLDELPQLINIIKGELSFVGPRPERPEFVEEFKKEIPFYEMRLITKPGLTGWAQINFPHGLTKEDAYQKLEYDIFYLKNRSFILDLLIMIKTIRSFF
jgi:exopolysaccharide biosynthesis polyprenyl glycosylphosphotransferase